MQKIRHKYIPDKQKELSDIITSKLITAKKTQVLSLNNLNISSLPQGLFSLNSIHTLDLGFNNLTELPACFFSLKNLTILHLNNNPFELRNLEVLNLAFTYVKFLPREMVLMKKLKAIDLTGCELQGGVAKYADKGIDAILQFLQRKYDRSVYRVILLEKIVKKLKEWVYVDSSFEEIQEMMDTVMGSLKDVHTDDLRRLLRNLSHVFPQKMEDVDNLTIKTKLMQRVEMKSITKKDLFPDME